MVTYLRQDPTTNLMSPIEGVQVQPATQGHPVEISASGRIDASLLPTTYDPKVDVVAAEAVQAGDLCYLLWENNARVIRKAVATAWATLSTVFVKESYAQGAAAAAYIHGVMTLVNPGTFTAADVGTSIYLSPTIPGFFQKGYPTATGQFTQRVAVITDVTESTLSCFFIGYLDRGRTAGSGLVDTDPTVSAHLTDLNNPHQVTAAQVGALTPALVGAASGLAPLGADSLVPGAYLPGSMWKPKSVRVVMTTNVNLASPGAALDGLTMTAGDRVLLTNQTDLGAPGVYVWNSATTAMIRSTDADTAAELCESIWIIAEGTQAHSVWMNTNKTIPTLGSTLLTFVRILDPGWTNPLTTSGDLLMATTGGAASRLAAGANGLVLTMVAGLPKWSELSVSGMTNPMTDQGDIVYGGVNGVPTRLARGVAAQVLTVSNGGAPYWVAPTTGFANPMQDGGDLILGGSGGTATRLAAGSNGQVLTMVSGAVQWAAGGLTNPMTTHGDLLWGTDSGVPRRLGLGANGQVLTVVSGGLQWAAPTTGFANPMYFPGDLILGGTNGEGTRLAPGTTGQVLTITTEGPRWAGASGLTNPMTTVGDLIVGGTSGAAGRMSVGANGQVLTVVSGVPTWTAPSSGFSNPMTTAGDLIYGSTGGAGARLAAGTENQVLSMKSGFPTWVTGGGSYSDPMTTPGDMLVRGASATQRLAKGAEGQVLTMVAGAPAWAAAGGGGGGMSNPMTALGQIIVSTDLEGTPGALDLGAEGQVLTVANGAPAWVDASGGTGGGELVITAPNAINFAAPSSTDYTGETLPYLRSDLNQAVGNYHEASVPATPGATYKWEIEGNLTPGLIGPNVFPVVQGTPANVLQFSAMVHTSIRIKCTKTSPTGLVEHAERVVAVNHRGRKLLFGNEAWGLSYMQTNVFGANDGVVGTPGVGLFVGTTGAVVYPSQSVYNGTLYMVDGSCIRTLSDDRKHLATLAGQGWQGGYVDGAAADAQFGYPVELVWDMWHDNLLVVDQEPDGQMPYHIRRIDAATGAVSTVNHWTSWLDVNGNPQGNPLLPDAAGQLISICYRANRFWILVSVLNSPNTWAIWTGADVGGNNVLQQIYVGVVNPGTTEGFPSKIRITADDGLYLLFPTKVKVVNGNHMTPSGTSVSDFAGFISRGLSQEEHNHIGYMNDKVNDPGNLWDGKALIQNATDMVVSHDPADTVDSLYLTDNGCIRKVNMVSTNHELVTLSTQHGQNWLTSQLAVRQDATGFILVADQIFELTDDTWITAPLPENLPTLPALQQEGSGDFGVVQISESAPLIVRKMFGVSARGRAAFYKMDVIPGSRWGVDIKTPNHNIPPLVTVLDSVTGATLWPDDFSDPDVEMAHIKVSQVSNIEAAGRLYVRILLPGAPGPWDAVHGVWTDVPCPPTIIPALYGGVTNPGGLTNPMTALGDLITADASGVPQRLGVGAEGQVLKVVSGNPAWGDSTGGSGGGMSITSVDTIAFSKPVLATDDTYYSGFALPFFKSDGTTLSGDLYEASVPALTGATYDWHGSTGIMNAGYVDNTLLFHACVLMGIHLKCTRTAADGSVEVAEKDIKVTYQGVYVGWFGQGTINYGGGDGLISSSAVGMSNATGGVAYDAVGNLYWAETGCIRKLTADGTTIQTLAGTSPTTSNTGYVDATGYDARFGYNALRFVFMGTDLFVADPSNYRIRKVTSGGVVTTYAGSGSTGTPPASALNAAAIFNSPRSVATDGTNLYVVDCLANGGESCLILRVSGTVTEIFFDTTANFAGEAITGVTVRPGEDSSPIVYISLKDRILQVTSTTEATVVAGRDSWDRPLLHYIRYGEATDYDGTLGETFVSIQGIQWINSKIYVCDFGMIRTVDPATTEDARTKTLYVHLQGSSTTGFAVNPTDFETVVVGGISNSPLVTYTPSTLTSPGHNDLDIATGFTPGSYPGQASFYGSWRGYVVDETCPTYYYGSWSGKTGCRSSIHLFESQMLESWAFWMKVPENLSVPNLQFSDVSEGSPYDLYMGYNGIRNVYASQMDNPYRDNGTSQDYLYYSLKKTVEQRSEQSGVTRMALITTLSAESAIPGPRVLPALWGGSSTESGGDGRPAFIPVPNTLNYNLDGKLCDIGVAGDDRTTEFFYTGKGALAAIALDHGNGGEFLEFTYDENGLITSIDVSDPIGFENATGSSGSAE